MSSNIRTYTAWEDGKQEAIDKCILPVTPTSHKGSSGRVAVLGGSVRYTGAPFYAAMAALRAGSDLATVFTAHEATIPIKCYSPELMVQGVYAASEFEELCLDDDDNNRDDEQIQSMVDKIVGNLDRIHCLVIGPGMGRCPLVMEAVALTIERAMKLNVYIVLDADGLFMLSQPKYRKLLQGYERAVLTPNIMEYNRLYEEASDDLEDPFQGVTIVKKGLCDEVLVDGVSVLTCAEEGGLKRAGGIGDVLAGALSTFIAWHVILNNRGNTDGENLQLACWSACCLLKRATKNAFEAKGRAMSATDIIDELGPAFGGMMK